MIARCVPLVLVGLVAACEPVDPAQTAQAGPRIILPESVIAIAAPNQDLSTARVLPADNCYWYSHAGPVETTLLPLRTVEGRPICVRTEQAAAES